MLAAGAAGCDDGVQRIDIGSGEALSLRFAAELDGCEHSLLRGVFGDGYANGVVRANDGSLRTVRCVSLSIADNEAFNRELFRSLGAAGWEVRDGAANAINFQRGDAALGVLAAPLPLDADERTAHGVAFIFVTPNEAGGPD